MDKTKRRIEIKKLLTIVAAAVEEEEEEERETLEPLPTAADGVDGDQIVKSGGGRGFDGLHSGC